jgi:hypothetical protein
MFIFQHVNVKHLYIRPGGVHTSQDPDHPSEWILFGGANHLGSFAWNLSYVTLLTPGILRWLLIVWKIRAVLYLDGKGGCGYCRENLKSHRINIRQSTKLWVCCHHGMARPQVAHQPDRLRMWMVKAQLSLRTL